jgi:hypothetical protein
MEGLHIQVRHISHIQVGHHDMLCHGRVRTRTPHWHFADSDVLGTYRDRYIPFYELEPEVLRLRVSLAGEYYRYASATVPRRVP